LGHPVAAIDVEVDDRAELLGCFAGTRDVPTLALLTRMSTPPSDLMAATTTERGRWGRSVGADGDHAPAFGLDELGTWASLSSWAGGQYQVGAGMTAARFVAAGSR
jgi:hypothetical protein